jgi:hypothetical protein
MIELLKIYGGHSFVCHTDSGLIIDILFKLVNLYYANLL